MTAFGRGHFLGENEHFLVEMHSVNSRHLEIVVNMPGELTEFDPRLRKIVRAAVSRGHVTVFVSCQPAYGRGQGFRVNAEMARALKEAYDQLRQLLAYEGDVDFFSIASRYDLVVPGNPPADPEQRWSGLKAAAEEALSVLIAMKQTEGENLRPALADSLDELQRTLASIEELAPVALQRHKETLKARIADAAPGLADNDERILREIVILADRLDLTEEINRIKSHLDQFRSIMAEVEPCGRTMHFLTQEVNREINTIGAKSDDLRISRLVVSAKTELEKLREQSSNIE
jgi:uncharacterized protein (TIGR00255 family)